MSFCIGLEMAITFHGWIPEAVDTVTSVRGRSTRWSPKAPFQCTCKDVPDGFRLSRFIAGSSRFYRVTVTPPAAALLSAAKITSNVFFASLKLVSGMSSPLSRASKNA
jgi:hypothetical protein